MDAGLDGGAVDTGADDAGTDMGTDAGRDAGPPDMGLPPLDYTDDANWLCRPGKPDDHCLSADLTATEYHADGTTSVVTSTAAVDPPYDCFYVYPTVDLTGPPGNHTDFSDLGPMLDPLLSQAARLREQCRVVAPLYRQVTLTGQTGAAAVPRLDAAYKDVSDAFHEYLARDGGTRPFVLFGHSQGSWMCERLLDEVVAPDPALRARLVVALLIGGAVQVPTGATTGGTIGDVPLCASDSEVGCAIHYHTFAEGHSPPAGCEYCSTLPGDMVACVNPANLASGTTETPSRAAIFATTATDPLINPPLALTPLPPTPFVIYRDYYALACASNANLHDYLESRARPATGDMRVDPIRYGDFIFSPSLLGMHVLDVELALGDLMNVVATKAAAHGP